MKKLSTLAVHNYPIYGKNDEIIAYEILKEFKISSELYFNATTNNSPQNAGVYQAIVHYSNNSYAKTIHLKGKEVIFNFIENNGINGIKFFEVTQAKGNIHPVKEQLLKQKCVAKKWVWKECKNINEIEAIFENNIFMLQPFL